MHRQRVVEAGLAALEPRGHRPERLSLLWAQAGQEACLVGRKVGVQHWHRRSSVACPAVGPGHELQTAVLLGLRVQSDMAGQVRHGCCARPVAHVLMPGHTTAHASWLGKELVVPQADGHTARTLWALFATLAGVRLHSCEELARHQRHFLVVHELPERLLEPPVPQRVADDVFRLIAALRAVELVQERKAWVPLAQRRDAVDGCRHARRLLLSE
mmetsp:Transcript_9935/g.31110  ORF Transcript_9935/g.31110 Transcript_9935/m.31110 type:complete len:215 (-) Transcript_9935:27-671(-)